MAKTTKAFSDDELQLKKRARRRLVGVIALVLVVVVFLPMILDNEPKPLSEDIAINIPPILQPDAAAPLPAPEPPPPPPRVTEPPAPPPASAPAPRTETRTQTQTQTQTVRPAPGPTAAREGYVVQLGAFSNPANARQLLEKLRENRFSAYAEVVSTPNGERTRVRVGPYPSRDTAEQARERLRARKLVIGDATIVQLGN
ncbi:MAG TPA: SPOR domain-containing protein [Burkholderiales bacterium]|nr:SPOR domain-containing protein [Burkholderiales bacterium]